MRRRAQSSFAVLMMLLVVYLGWSGLWLLGVALMGLAYVILVASL
jgi:hypothetical protein